MDNVENTPLFVLCGPLSCDKIFNMARALSDLLQDYGLGYLVINLQTQELEKKKKYLLDVNKVSIGGDLITNVHKQIISMIEEASVLQDKIQESIDNMEYLKTDIIPKMKLVPNVSVVQNVEYSDGEKDALRFTLKGDELLVEVL